MNASLRWAVLERDLFTCRYCGRSAPDVELHVDHVFPRSAGGEDSFENLVTACRDCNLGKRTKDGRGGLSATARIAALTAEADEALSQQWTVEQRAFQEGERHRDELATLHTIIRTLRVGRPSVPQTVGEILGRNVAR